MNLENVIKHTGGKIFRATFIKRTNGETRNLTGRLGVRKGIKGVGLKFNPSERGLMVVFDMHKRNFRMINLESLREVKFKGLLYR
jgi:hypothetical protein